MTPGALVAQVAELLPGTFRPPELEVVPGAASLASCFEVETALLAAAGATNLAADIPTLERDVVAATCATHVRVDGRTPPTWAPLSGYYPTGDGGRIQLHANFPHHAAGIVELLGASPDRDTVAGAILGWDATALEAAMIERGLVAARLRSLDEWEAHPHAAATRDLPLLTVERLGDAAPRSHDRRIRVLDATRVLAGPVAGQTLAAHGADVMRVGAPTLPSVELAVLSTGSGKRNSHADLATADGRAAFADLLAGADVWFDAFRPGALAGRGFGLDRVAPGAVVVQISAFDVVGPWAGRRGYDSIVQSTTGLVDAGSRAAGEEQPRPLPVQALDYATGFWAAFAAQRLVAHQAAEGGTWLARLSLLRTRNWLVGLGGPYPFVPAPPDYGDDALQVVDTPFGRLETARPIGGAWAHGPRPLGVDPPRWQP